MSVDYKQMERQRADTSGSFLIGLFFGFLLGLAVAAGIALFFFNTPVPFSSKLRMSEKAPPPPVGETLAEPAKTPPADQKPRFDFYRILPQQEEPVSDKQLRDAAKQAAAKPGAPQDTYFLQAGSFQNPAEADNLKARLALMGIEATVAPAEVAGKGVWYRVRLGPYTNVDDINRVRQQLAQNGVNASLVRLKDAAQN